MLSNTIRIGRESQFLSGFYAADGIDRTGQKFSSGFPVIGKPAGFSGCKIAAYEGHGCSVSIAGKPKQEEERDKEQRRRYDTFNQPLSSRRIYPIQGFMRLFLFHPQWFQRNRWLYRCSAQLTQSSVHCSPRPCVIGDLAIYVQTGWITRWLSPACRKKQSLVPAKRKESQTKKTVRKERSWQVGNGMIVGGKAIFPDRDTVFFQLYFDYYASNYANNVNYPARQGALSGYEQLHWPSCGDGAVTVTSHGEWKQDLMASCPEESFQVADQKEPEESTTSRVTIPGFVIALTFLAIKVSLVLLCSGNPCSDSGT